MSETLDRLEAAGVAWMTETELAALVAVARAARRAAEAVGNCEGASTPFVIPDEVHELWDALDALAALDGLPKEAQQ